MIEIRNASLVFGHSFFDEQLFRRGIDLSQGRGNLELMSTNVETIVSKQFVLVSASEKVCDAIKILSEAGVGEGYCLDDHGRLLGKCALPSLSLSAANGSVSDCLDNDPVKLNGDSSILQAMEIASSFIGENMPVIEASTGEMLGVVSEADIFDAYLNLQSRVHDLEHS